VLYGRGAVDMKGAIACFLAATARFLERHRLEGSISFLITGDEEGPAINGTRKVLGWLKERGETLDACVVGEPTSAERLGDTIKIGRRGSLSARLTVSGVQGHVAYPARADNPIPRLLTMLQALSAEPLDAGSEHFQPSEAEARASFNIRFNDRHTARELETALRGRLDATGGDYRLEIHAGAEAFRTMPGPFTDLVQTLIVVECGLVGATIHQVDERVALPDLDALTRVYQALLASFVRSA
jgi:succinyl-diaminopimelate desuccinylase